MLKSKAALLGLATLSLLPLTGCIGIYDNSKLFTPTPQVGMSELELLKQYGTPSYSDFVDDKKVHIYKIRNNQYIVLFGKYDGYDLVITCDNGQVIDIDRAERGEAFALFNPVPWAEAE
ncbi:MAG: hypothetical protein SFY68_02420 [Candidatus Sumerlaeia bacterium]|nr:hypothetical protein [Candidatus Sumerlaeia bacterium]